MRTFIAPSLAILAVALLAGCSAGATGADPSQPSDTTSAATQEAPAAPAEPEATAASWADEQWGAFEAVTETGTGDSLITLPEGATGGIVTATHDGSRNFVLSVLDAANSPTGELLVNTIGTYSGTTAWGVSALGEGTRMQVTADGDWSITLSPMSAAPSLAADGAGDAVFLYDGSAGALTATHDGERNFVIVESTDKVLSMGLLVNEIGTYSGTVPLSAGPSVITVTADGRWTLAVE